MRAEAAAMSACSLAVHSSPASGRLCLDVLISLVSSAYAHIQAVLKHLFWPFFTITVFLLSTQMKQNCLCFPGITGPEVTPAGFGTHKL